ncbi:MAG: galactose-1-phosphate uridylyltransferase [Candidatus Goldiibacteriota bacterium]
MSELRKDPVVNRWVITLDDKNFVPRQSSGLPGDLPGKDSSCPFCPGSESKTGHEIYRLKGKNGWQIRVIPNNRPYLRVEEKLKRKSKGIFDYMNGTGANEVFIETPEHNVDIDEMSGRDAANIFKTYIERIKDLKNDNRLEYIMFFKNRGERAGSSIIHAHSQLIALPIIPEKVKDEMDSSAEYFKLKKRCVYCDVVDNELSTGRRIVAETAHFAVIAPFASVSPFELWVIPKKHSCHFHDAEESALMDLGSVMKMCIRKINRALNRPAYNYMIHTGPLKGCDDEEYYHWHIEIFPRIKYTAGFEWGSGFHINPTLPEEAAEYLRGIK